MNKIVRIGIRFTVIEESSLAIVEIYNCDSSDDINDGKHFGSELFPYKSGINKCACKFSKKNIF